MLMKNKTGRIVSKAKHAIGVKRMKEMMASGQAAFSGKKKRSTKGKKKSTRTKRSRSRSCK